MAPYRLEQTAAGHLLAPISALLPLSLWTFGVPAGARAGGSCRPRWRSPPSRPGQVHLALGAVPFYLAYVLVRTRATWPVVAAVVGVLLAAAAGVLVWLATIDGSIGEGGLAAPGRALLRGLARLRRAPRPPRVGELRLPGLADAARRHRGARPAHPLALVRAGAVLGAATLVPVVLALGTTDAHLRSRALSSGRFATPAFRSD